LRGPGEQPGSAPRIGAHIEDKTVDNRTDDQHGIGGYLDDALTARLRKPGRRLPAQPLERRWGVRNT
jgi:hypothetical protein